MSIQRSVLSAVLLMLTAATDPRGATQVTQESLADGVKQQPGMPRNPALPKPARLQNSRLSLSSRHRHIQLNLAQVSSGSEPRKCGRTCQSRERGRGCGRRFSGGERAMTGVEKTLRCESSVHGSRL